MKRKIFFCALITGIIAVLSVGIAAYFTTDGTAVNVITAGSVKIELLETVLKDGETEKIPFENIISIVPDTSVSKIVTVKNTGKSPEYVRVSVKKEILLSDGAVPENASSLIETDFNTEYWTEHDGYWYYNKILESGQETEPLFTKAVFAKEMKNIYQDSKALIDIKAFGVQSDNNGGSPTEAVGWSDNK